MKPVSNIFSVMLFSIAVSGNAAIGIDDCAVAPGVVLQVLGSGGPIADDNRASAAYLVWVNGHSRFLIDTGGGAFLRFGEAGASFEDLSHIAISHFHTDHSSDLVALLKSGFFSDRTKSLSISGPVGGGDYPGLDVFLQRQLGTGNGAYEYLAGYLDGSGGLVMLDIVMADPETNKTITVFTDDGEEFEVLAIGVPHGPVPTLAYRINIGQQSIVFSGDQNGSSETFIEFAQDADVLVMHMPVPESISGVGRRLHAPPSVIGEIAANTGAGKLVLSHFMARSLKNIEGNLEIIRSNYAGTVIPADDLTCIMVNG